MVVFTAYGQTPKAPAYPLLTHDPYFSVWSFNDTLNADVTRHWTGAENSLLGIARVDGVCWYFIGKPQVPGEAIDTSKLKKAIQLRRGLTATQTQYTMRCGGVDIELAFISPLLMANLDQLSKPISYVTFGTRTNDGKNHEVQIYFGVYSGLVVDKADQIATAEQVLLNYLGTKTALKMGSKSQETLVKTGDDVRIDWGYLYVSAAGDKKVQSVSVGGESILSFCNTGSPAGGLNIEGTNICLNTVFNLGSVGGALAHSILAIGYDDIKSIKYFKNYLSGWWRTQNVDGQTAIQAATKDFYGTQQACNKFDKEFEAKATEVGGRSYYHLCVLAYRQALAANKLVRGPKGEALMFPKENFSNGCIGTVDVIYPSAPIFLVFNPALLKASLDPLFYYVESGLWDKPFAPHDLGVYPHATGQVYPGDMPVEECGNMILLTAGIVRAEGKAAYAQAHWKSLTQWAEYLKSKGFDPEDQLCTDDFAGRLARNANLSVKTICALGAYGWMAKQSGDSLTGNTYITLAKDLAKRWEIEAADGDHTVLAFGQKNTWSQKYNMVWDKLLKLDLFSSDVYKREVKWYLKKQNLFGLPLDNRKTYTKSDWVLWSACLADNASDFEALMAPIYKYTTETPDRVPLTDLHETTDGKAVGMRARSVVGGYFMKWLLESWK